MFDEPSTDERLLQCARDGNEAAFSELYERYHDALFRFAYRLLGSAEAAEDATHDCFISIVTSSSAFDATRGSLQTYLYAAARNHAFKRLRRAGVDPLRLAVEDLDEAQQAAPARGEPLHRLLAAELGREVERAVAALPALQREALILFEYEDLSLAEIAAIVEADTGTIKARLHRARVNLRRALTPYMTGALAAVGVEKS